MALGLARSPRPGHSPAIVQYTDASVPPPPPPLRSRLPSCPAGLSPPHYTHTYVQSVPSYRIQSTKLQKHSFHMEGSRLPALTAVLAACMLAASGGGTVAVPSLFTY